MGRHKLPYKMKKPNEHHKYWRYVLSTGPRTEISTRTKVKYEAERIAKEAYIKSIEQLDQCITFGRYAADFFIEGKCKLTIRKKASNKPFTSDMLRVRKGQLDNYLMKRFKDTKMDEIDLFEYEDWRMNLSLANSTKNGITVTMKQILNEAVREKIIPHNPLLQVDSLSKTSVNPRDSLTVAEMKKLFPLNNEEALKVWITQKYHTLLFLIVSSGMRSGEVRALRWGDVIWDDSGILITKACKNSGLIGTVKEKKEKFVRLPNRTMQLLKDWKKESLAVEETDFIFYGKGVDKPIDKRTILDNFKRAMTRVGVGEGKNLLVHSLRHTFNSYLLSVLPSEVVRKFTGHSSEQMTNHYYHPLLKEELKNTEKYQGEIDKIWDSI